MANKQPRKILCVGGPFNGYRLDFDTSTTQGYIEYNISFGQSRQRWHPDPERHKIYPKSIMVWVEKE